MDQSNQERNRIASRISQHTILGNVVLSMIKLVVGFYARSNALIADGVHSLSDIGSTVAVIIGVKLSSQPEDEKHPYGHEKIEPIIAKILATILLVTALGIGYGGIKTIITGDFVVPGYWAIYGAIISIGIKEWMYQYTIKGAKKIRSSALMADAWHHRSDALSSIAALMGIIGARMGFPMLDPLAAIMVCLVIVKVAIEIYVQAINQVIDKAADEETINELIAIILEIQGVEQIDELKTRIHGNKLFVDVDIAVDQRLSVKEGHNIAENVHNQIEKSKHHVKHCMVHVNPKKVDA
jgi:cation diffusion facilitator family transporter